MAISKGNTSATIQELCENIGEANILSKYLNIHRIPCLINSPIRKDNNPSFSIYSTDGEHIKWKDHSNNTGGNLYSLLSLLWDCSFIEVLNKVIDDFKTNTKDKENIKIICHCTKLNVNNKVELKCKIRQWKEYDIKYWESYGINLSWLKYAEVYPISHKIIIKNKKRYVFGADKYAYAYVEHKENKVTLKIYQPFNKKFKWTNSHDKSVISLWTKVPRKGDKIVICSSLKDALCLWSNTGIPAIAVQGEGYSISQTAIKELKNRYKQIFIILDNDKPGLEDAKKLAEQTGFINLTIPQFEGGKDISDYFKINGENQFKKLFKQLLNYGNKEIYSC